MGGKNLPDDSFDDDFPEELIEPLIKEVPKELINPINDKKETVTKKAADKRSEVSQKSKITSAARVPEPEQKGEDLTQLDQSLEPVRGWDFVAQKLPARKKQGFLSKLVSWAAYYSGKTIGKIGGIAAAIGKALWGLVTPGPGTMGGTFKRLRGSSRFQPRGDTDNIPGWDGAKFENEPVKEGEISLDFRRVPEVWSYPTAEKAAEGKADDREAKPRDPVISVYIYQASKKYTVTDNDDTGHTGIGIEYSRYDPLSGRWQRYNLRFGYYMGGGGASMTSKMAVSSYNNAMIPGKLMNEKDDLYSISRSFQAKPKQVSDVLRAAESFADRGGYNQYTRNCTTFAKEMIVDVAKIKGAEGIFAKDDIRLQKKQDAKMFGAGALAPIYKADMENGFEKMRNKDDLDYKNFGRKMASREDYERYKNSLKLWSSHITKGHSPNASAENMRRSEGGKSGTIGSYLRISNGTKDYREAPISVVISQIPPLVSDSKTKLTSITPLDKLTDAEMTPELKDLMADLDGNKIFMDLLKLFPQQDEKLFAEKTPQSDLMKGRAMMTDLIKKLNTLLFRYYRNDKRVQNKVLPIISVLNHGIIAIDSAYNSTEVQDQTGSTGELKDLTNNFGRKSYNFTFNGNTLELTASEYEAWLQIYQTPQKALEQLSRYLILKEKNESDAITDAEEKEYEKLDRINDLASDFERSHKYMLTKEKYNQQDVDYAFSLAKKEREGEVVSDIFEQNWNDPTMSKMKNPSASAAGIYQILIMKGVFGGMKDRFTSEFGDKSDKSDKNDMKTMLDWLSADAVDCVKSHKEEMKTIIRGMKHTTDKPDKAKLRIGFVDLLTKWIFQLFHGDRDVNQYKMMVKSLTSYNGTVMKEVYKIITDVMQEE